MFVAVVCFVGLVVSVELGFYDPSSGSGSALDIDYENDTISFVGSSESLNEYYVVDNGSVVGVLSSEGDVFSGSNGSRYTSRSLDVIIGYVSFLVVVMVVVILLWVILLIGIVLFRLLRVCRDKFFVFLV